MRGKGINYDSGFVNNGVSTHEPFDPEVVAREMRVIREDLHCTAVRITGGDADRLEIAATHAAAAGLEVWYSPFAYQLEPDRMLDFVADCAGRAEQLRRNGAEVVLLTGAELSISNPGFLPGNDLIERSNSLITSSRKRQKELFAEMGDRLNDFLALSVKAVRERFEGRVSYASIPFERIDWTPFDIISVDQYRSIEVAKQFRKAIHTLAAQDKPVAITEFGCTTHRGAGDKGARGGMIVEWDVDAIRPVRLDGHYIRDESEQATHLREVIEVFDVEGIDSAFVYTFANFHLPHRAAARDDLDMASFGVVKVLEEGRGEAHPGMAWEPKLGFRAVADAYGD